MVLPMHIAYFTRNKRQHERATSPHNKLLNNPEFHKRVVATLDDEDIKDFWINEFA